MVTMPQKLHDVLAAGHNIWVATVGPDGTPNVSIKGSGSLLDDRHLYFADLYHKETLENLRRNPHVAVGVHDYASRVAMQIKGHAEILDHGELVDEMRQKLAAVSQKWKLPPVEHVIRVTVDSVVDLWPGPHAGEESPESLVGAGVWDYD
jgi:predicted pyridoxine 5'-phosphate oxidase superfamily flavin-nucleotide-binding protein